MRQLVVIDAPSNLGLRPPAPGIVPGVYKLAGALRDQGLVATLGAVDAGVVVPPRYVPDWDGKTVRNGAAIAAYTRKLATRVTETLDAGTFPIVLGGDCSILLGNMLAVQRLGRRAGLVFCDAHSDFRHRGNSQSVGAAAGEDLALVTGHGDDALVAPDGIAPLVDPHHVCVVGVRSGDSQLEELSECGMAVHTAREVLERGASTVAADVIGVMRSRELEHYWIHLDLDVVDSRFLPAVDSPEAEGLAFSDLSELLCELVAAPEALGVEVTIFDPDLDESGAQAAAVTAALVQGLRPLLSVGSS